MLRLFLLLFAGGLALSGCRDEGTSSDGGADAASGNPWGRACPGEPGCTGPTACIVDERFPGGYCSKRCGDAGCGPGAACTRLRSQQLCLAECAGDAGCREAYQCWRGVCRPPCGRATDCGEGARCTDAGRCEAASDGGVELPNGSPCSSSAACASGICLPARLGGTCAAACVDSDACGSISKVCAPVGLDTDADGEPDRVAGACVERNDEGRFLAGHCARHDQCASHVCVHSQCAEVCDEDADCLAGQVCREVSRPEIGETYRGCWYPSRSGEVEVSDVELGPADVVAGSESGRINFAVPHDAVSITLLGRHTSGDLVPLVFANLWSPANETLFDFAEIAAYEDQPIRWLPLRNEEIVAMLVPNTTPARVRFRQGRYGAKLAGLASGPDDTRESTVDVVARIKRAAAGSVGSQLDLHVFLVDVGITADEAPSHDRLQNALGELDRIMGTVGVTLGRIQYFEVTGSAATRYGVIDSSEGPDSEMAELLRRSEPRSGLALNLFLVRSISDDAGERRGIALGIAGSIPGPPGVHGTMQSGVIVSFDSSVVGDDPNIVAQIAAHEIGHYLGLFHSTESGRPCEPGEEPTESDPCAPFGGEDPIPDTEYGDGSNLMYYALGGTDGSTYNVDLTEGQGYVVTRSALVH